MFENQLGDEVLEILRRRGTTPKQYLAWVVWRYRRDGLITGLSLAFLWLIFFTYFSVDFCFNKHVAESTHLEVFYVLLGVDLLFFLIFLFVGLAFREGSTMVSEFEDDGEYLQINSAGQNTFFTIWLNSMTTLRYLRKIKEPTWQKILTADPLILKKDSFKYPWPKKEKIIAKTVLLKKWSKRIGLISTPLFFLGVWLLAYRGVHHLSFFWDFIFKWTPALFYFLMIGGFSFWPIFHGLAGFCARDISFYGERNFAPGLEENRVTGIMAVFLSLLTISVSLFFFGLFFWLGWGITMIGFE